MLNQRPHTAAISYYIITIATFIALQGLVVVTHEFTHSTMAWLLDEMKSPADIVWGNPIMMTGWDENVPYRQLFAEGHDLHAAIIGICPLILHTTLIVIAMRLMRGDWLPERRWLYNAFYWLTVINFMELIAYVYMRSFAGHGDIGNFDKGLNLSPWWIFVAGSAVLTWGLATFYRQALPRLQTLFAESNPPLQWGMLILTSFMLFLWGSGIRVLAYVEGVQKYFGLIGIAGVLVTLMVFRPEGSNALGKAT